MKKSSLQCRDLITTSATVVSASQSRKAHCLPGRYPVSTNRQRINGCGCDRRSSMLCRVHPAQFRSPKIHLRELASQHPAAAVVSANKSRKAHFLPCRCRPTLLSLNSAWQMGVNECATNQRMHVGARYSCGDPR
jgi:hypothetical protein